MGNHSLDPGVGWPMDTKQQHPLLGPGCRALRVASRALSQTLIAPTSALHSQACCVTPGRSHDLFRPTSASFTHLHDLDHTGLPDLVSYSWPIGLGYIQLVLPQGFALIVPSSWNALPPDLGPSPSLCLSLNVTFLKRPFLTIPGGMGSAQPCSASIL